MIINKFLRLFSGEYTKIKSITKLIEFTKKTLPSDGTENIFIDCVLIMFNQDINGPSSSQEYFISIVNAGKENIGNINLLNI